MRVLLHICCAPCTIYPLKVLRGEGHEITGFFYNPNIHPYTEFQKRREALTAYSGLTLLPLIVDEAYDLETFLRSALEAGNTGVDSKVAPGGHPGSSDAPTKNGTPRPAQYKARCRACYGIRLEAAFRRAANDKADAVTTTLLYSIHQKHETIAAVAEDLSGRYHVPFLYRDFREGWREGQTQARSLGIYRQNYCGCIFSEYERFAGRPEKRGNTGSNSKVHREETNRKEHGRPR